MKVLLYGRLADAIDREVDVDAPGGCSVAEIRQRLAASHPGAAGPLRVARAAIDSALVGDDHIPAVFDQVEFLPPVSGG